MDLHAPAIASLSNGEIAIAAVCAALVGFALMVSMVIPKRRPNFPGRRNLLAFTLVALAFVAGMLAIVEIYGSEEAEGPEAAVREGAEPGEPEAAPPAGEESPGEESPAGEAPPAGEVPAPGEEPPTGEVPAPAAPPGDPIAGAPLFASSGCGACHTLADADAGGTIGPNLDESQPTFELAVERITNGTSVMPAFGGALSEQEIEDLAAYVVAAISG